MLRNFRPVLYLETKRTLAKTENSFGTLGDLTDRKEVPGTHHSDLTPGSSALLYPKKIDICTCTVWGRPVQKSTLTTFEAMTKKKNQR